MMEVIGKISISEVILLFLLLFILPILGMLVMRLRKYEALFGDLAQDGKEAAPSVDVEENAPPAAKPEDDSVPDDVFPYKSREFLTPADRACLDAMREALGPDVDIFPKVALWKTVESTEKDAGYGRRLHGHAFDFLVCDKRTGKALTAVMFNPAKGRPAGGIDELRKICKAAAANIVFIDLAEQYDVATMKEALGIPELDL